MQPQTHLKDKNYRIPPNQVLDQGAAVKPGKALSTKSQTCDP